MEKKIETLSRITTILKDFIQNNLVFNNPFHLNTLLWKQKIRLVYLDCMFQQTSVLFRNWSKGFRCPQTFLKMTYGSANTVPFPVSSSALMYMSA
ncbi:hypothetical protein WN944_018540 [Citrus x changshan-huyou]|uniref:Uncharacterized protein n=1 Tax=Citrus x changshan-huyou TaxID=2935761 RepID=A0AAP0LYB0_9ROSI